MSSEPLPALEVRGLGKKMTRDLPLARKYGARDILRELRPGRNESDLRPGEFWALRDVSFDVAPGEAVGVIGHNGAGKSTLLRLLHGLTRPDRGDITVRGRHAALLELGAPFNSVLSGRENIATAAAINGITGVDVDTLIEQVGDFAELGSVLDAPMWSYSNGMQMRLGYAIATQLDAQLLLVDEVLAVGDIAFQRKCMQHIRRHLDRGGSLVMVSHDLWMVQAVCHRCIQLVEGEVVADTSPNQAIATYMSRAREGKVFLPRTRTGFDAGPEHDAGLTVEVASFEAVDDGELRNGARVAIEVEVSAVRPVQGVRWHIDILMANRQVCLSRIEPPSLDPDGDLAVGTARFRCEIPSLPLFPNTYYVVAHLTDRVTGEALASSAKPYPIEVHSRDSRLDVLALFAGAQSSLDTTYELDPPEA